MLIKKIVSILCFTTLFFAQTLEEKAFEAYKLHKYKEAFALYVQGAKLEHVKAIFMLGLFFEKGVGTSQNRKKALKLYKMTIKTALLKAEKGEKKELQFALLAAKRLYFLTKEKKYQLLIKKIEKLLNKIKSDKENSPKSVNNKKYEKFVALCPAAKIIPKEDAYGIEKFNCELFQEFPERMKEFMRLKKEYFLAKKEKDSKKIALIERKLNVLLIPIIKYIEQETFNCYANANYYYDIKSCDYDYLAQTDELFFKKRAKILEEKMKESKIEDYKLDTFQKEYLLNNLLEHFSNKTYEKEVFKIVRIY